jgi:serine/threonine-protein kinase RsbW/stage II sporulation protein AB (anti-sigma F factor)
MTRAIPPPSEPLSDRNGRFEQRARALPENVGALRRGIVAFAARHGLDAAACVDVALAASEALTNAVIHGFVGRSPGTLRAIAEISGDGLIVRIIDDGRGMISRTDSPGAGVGVPLMARLASNLDIREGPDGRGTETRLTFNTPSEASDR